jgi:hypothetical protein
MADDFFIDQPSVQVVYTNPGGLGYNCVYYMARLAAELLNGELTVLEERRPALKRQLSSLLLPRRKSPSICLLICPKPIHLNSVLFLPDWRKRYGRIVAWVFDSFWTEHMPRWVRSSRLFEHVFVTEQEDLTTWRDVISAPVDWLPWGSDVLNLGSDKPARRFDLLRFGRQPAEWEDDQSTSRECEFRMLNFQGRPPAFSDATENQHALMRFLSNAKFTLAFSNRVSPSIQTHPSREYITGRWTDSLAAGATVAGVPPLSQSVKSLLWPEALLDFGSTDQREGLEVIASAVREWTPERARLNYLKSLERLDWRWRFKAIADALGIRPLQLNMELKRLIAAIDSAQPVSLID